MSFQVVCVWTSDFVCKNLEMVFRSYGMFHFFKKLPNNFSKSLCHFTFPPAGMRGLVGASPNQHMMWSVYLIFKLYFPYDVYCQTSFHILIHHLYIFFGIEYFEGLKYSGFMFLSDVYHANFVFSLWDCLFILHWNAFIRLLKSRCSYMCGPISGLLILCHWPICVSWP